LPEVYSGILVMYVQLKSMGLRSDPPKRNRVLEVSRIVTVATCLSHLLLGACAFVLSLLLVYCYPSHFFSC
jgi:hypothetical protein